jgi:hypothetical protein
MRWSASLVGASLLALVLTAGLAQADGYGQGYVAPGPNSIISSNNQFSVDYTQVNFGYKEIGSAIFPPSGVALDTEGGWVPGVSVSFSLMHDLAGLSNVYFSARYSYFNGETNYTGAFIGGGPFGSVVAKDGATVNDVDVRLGKGFALGSDIMLTPFFGIGYQDWNRAVNAGEDYTHEYYGAGLLLQVSPFSRLVLSADGLVGETFGSHIDVNFIAPSIPGFSASLGDSTIYKLGLSADYAVTSFVHVNAGLEYENFSYGQYCCSAGFGEPNSRTSNLTFRVGAGIAFDNLFRESEPFK